MSTTRHAQHKDYDLPTEKVSQGIEADRAALAEVGWVSHEALALAREGVGQDDPRRVEFLSRKRAVLDYIEAQGTFLTRTQRSAPPRLSRGGRCSVPVPMTPQGHRAIDVIRLRLARTMKGPSLRWSSE